MEYARTQALARAEYARTQDPEEFTRMATAEMPPTVSPSDAYNWLANDFVNNYLKVTLTAFQVIDFCAQTEGHGFSVGAIFKKRAITSRPTNSGRVGISTQEEIWTVQECDATLCRVVFKVENVTEKTTWLAKYKEDSIVKISFSEEEKAFEGIRKGEEPIEGMERNGVIQTSWTQVIYYDEYVLGTSSTFWDHCIFFTVCICLLPCYLIIECDSERRDPRKKFHRQSQETATTLCEHLKVKLQDVSDDGTLHTLVSVVDVVNPKEIEMSRMTMTKDQAEKELIELKRYLDLGIITQDDHDKKAISFKRTLLGNY